MNSIIKSKCRRFSSAALTTKIIYMKKTTYKSAGLKTSPVSSK